MLPLAYRAVWRRDWDSLPVARLRCPAAADPPSPGCPLTCRRRTRSYAALGSHYILAPACGGLLSGMLFYWRRDWDSNPGSLAGYTLSRRAPSTTRTSLRAWPYLLPGRNPASGATTRIIACGEIPPKAVISLQHYYV